jgi:hypothetical protein
MDSESFVATFAFLAVFGFPVAAFVFSRWLAHRERMEMIRHGMPPPGGKADWRAMRAQAPVAGSNPYAGYDAGAAHVTLRKGITVAFIGLALTIGLSFIGYSDSIPFGVRWRPGPWLLGGLVPLFVGLAQIISAILSGASFGAVQRSGGYPPQGPAAPSEAPSPPGQSFDGSYAYRPDQTQELQPPGKPPERRP